MPNETEQALVERMKQLPLALIITPVDRDHEEPHARLVRRIKPISPSPTNPQDITKENKDWQLMDDAESYLAHFAQIYARKKTEAAHAAGDFTWNGDGISNGLHYAPCHTGGLVDSTITLSDPDSIAVIERMMEAAHPDMVFRLEPVPPPRGSLTEQNRRLEERAKGNGDVVREAEKNLWEKFRAMEDAEKTQTGPMSPLERGNANSKSAGRVVPKDEAE